MKIIISIGIILLFAIGNSTNSKTQTINKINLSHVQKITFPQVKHDSSLIRDFNELNDNIKTFSEVVKTVKKCKKDSSKIKPSWISLKIAKLKL